MTESNRSSIGVRVRPNADRFVTDLRAQLASKKYTYYVDVRANTTKATTDVKSWAGTTLKSIDAKVLVGANTALATGDMSRWRARQKQIKTLIPITADTSQASREIEAWRKIAGRDLEIKVKANVTGRLTEIERVRRAAEKEAKLTVRGDSSNVKNDIKRGIEDASQLSMFTVDVDADTKKAKLKINELITQGEQLSFDLGVDVDTSEAKAQLKELQKEAKALSPKQEVDLQTAKARRDLAMLRLEAARKKIAIDVDVKTRKWDLFSKRVNDLEKAMGNATVIRSLDFGPINLGKPTGMVGTLATITALAGLVPGLVTGMAALSDTFIRLAGAASMLPGILGGIGASFGTLQVGMFGFSNALDAMFKVWTEPTDKIERTQRNTIKWTNDLAKSLANEKQAQRAVGDARRDATNDLRNLNNELRGSVLNEAQAILDLQRARDKIAQGDFENATEATQARLDEAFAYENLISVRERNTQLYQKAGEDQTKGVENSDKVTAALEQQARASEAVALAMQSIAMANPMGAQSLFEDAMDRLSPKARAAVEAIGGLRSEITIFQRSLQDRMFDGVAEQITATFQNLAPSIMPGMNAIADGLNQNILSIFESLNSPDGQSIIERILGGTAEAQRLFSAVIDPLIRGFGTLIAAGAEHLPQLVNLIGTLADRFALFIENADKDGTLDKFMSDGIKAFGNLIELVINGIKIVNDFSNAFRSSFGTDLLTKMVQITDKWHEFLSSAEGQKKLNDYIEKAKQIWEKWQPILSDLPGIFEKISDAAKAFLDAFLPVLNTVTSALEKWPWLAEAFFAVWIFGKVATAGVNMFKFAKLIAGIGTAIAGMGDKVFGLLTRLAPYLPWIGKYFDKGFLPDASGPGSGGGGGGVAPAGGGGDGKDGKGKDGKGGGKGGGKAGRLGRLGGALGKVGGIVGKVFTPLLIGSMVLDEISSNKAANDAYSQWQEARNAATNEADRRKIDKEVYGSLGIDIGDSGKYPVLSEFDFSGFANPPGSFEPIMEQGFVVKDGKIIGKQDGQEYGMTSGSYAKGGMTNWPRGIGRNAILHGQEFVLPADAVSMYGNDLLEAMRQRKIPPGMLRGFSGGGDPQDEETGTPHHPTPTNAEQPNPAAGPGLLPTIAAGAAAAASSAVTAATGPGAQAPYTGGYYNPGVDSTGLYNPLGGPTGQLPGPAPIPNIPAAIPGIDGAVPGSTPGNQTTALNVDINGNPVKIGSIPLGWPGGSPPVGLGGGTDGYDIRRELRIGPGPAGSTPADWAKWGVNFTSELVGGLGEAVLRGFLGIFGIDGILDNTYLRSAMGLVNHFFGPQDSKAQGAGAADSNAAANALIDVNGQMQLNPAYPGIPAPLNPGMFPGYFGGYNQTFMQGTPMSLTGMPGMPGMPGYIPGGTPLPVGGAAGSEEKLRSATVGGRRALAAAFPFLRDIGGFREDSKKWHPNGQALDAMIPTELQFTPQGYAIGDTITNWALQNAGGLGVEHVIWNKKIYYPDGRVEDATVANGSKTDNHEDHPHIVFKETPYPDQNTKYMAPPAGIMQFALNQQGYPVAVAGGQYTPMTMPNQQNGIGTYTGAGTNTSSGGSSGSSSTSSTSSGGGSSSSSTSGPGKTWPSSSGKSQSSGMGAVPPENVKFYAQALALQAGFTDQKWKELNKLINELSGWNPNKRTTGVNTKNDRFGIGQIASITRERMGILNEHDAIKQFKAVLAIIEMGAGVGGNWKDIQRYARMNGGFARGGQVFGAGTATSDSVPALLSNGEHVLTAEEVKKMGGHKSVYAFRDALNSGRISGLEGGGESPGGTLADLWNQPGVDMSIYDGLTPQMSALAQHMDRMFPQAANAGKAARGWRPIDHANFGTFSEHNSGQAWDMYIPPNLIGTPEGKEMGDAMSQEFLKYGADYALWQQQEIHKNKTYPMETRDNGNITANHGDHSHGRYKAYGPSILESGDPLLMLPQQLWEWKPSSSAKPQHKMSVGGGIAQGQVVPKPPTPPEQPRKPFYPPPNQANPIRIPAEKKIVPPPAPPQPTEPKPLPPQEPPVVGPAAPMPIPALPSLTPPIQPPDQSATQGPQGSETTNQPSAAVNSNTPGSFDHVHPALAKGIASGAAVAATLTEAAIAAGTMGAGAAGAAGAAAGAAGGGAAGGAAGGMGLPTGVSIQGIFQQGAKVVTNAANIAASFLVGSITGGTTANAYGATQMPNTPSGGTKIYDASTSIGSIHTSDLDEYYRRENRRQAQRAQSGLGQWGNR